MDLRFLIVDYGKIFENSKNSKKEIFYNLNQNVRTRQKLSDKNYDVEKLAKGYIIILREATSYKAEYASQLVLTKKRH